MACFVTFLEQRNIAVQISQIKHVNSHWNRLFESGGSFGIFILFSKYSVSFESAASVCLSSGYFEQLCMEFQNTPLGEEKITVFDSGKVIVTFGALRLLERIACLSSRQPNAIPVMIAQELWMRFFQISI